VVGGEWRRGKFQVVRCSFVRSPIESPRSPPHGQHPSIRRHPRPISLPVTIRKNGGSVPEQIVILSSELHNCSPRHTCCPTFSSAFPHLESLKTLSFVAIALQKNNSFYLLLILGVSVHVRIQYDHASHHNHNASVLRPSLATGWQICGYLIELL